MISSCIVSDSLDIESRFSVFIHFVSAAYISIEKMGISIRWSFVVPKINLPFQTLVAHLIIDDDVFCFHISKGWLKSHKNVGCYWVYLFYVILR